MRWGAIGLVVLLTGCAARPAQQDEPLPLSREPVHEAVSASALAFDPPTAQGELWLDLSREERQPGAYAGYESPTTSFFRVRIDDQQNDGFDDRYIRRAIVERVGTTVR